MTPAARAEALRLLDLADARLRRDRDDARMHDRGLQSGLLARVPPAAWAGHREFRLGRIWGLAFRRDILKDRR